MKIQVWKDTLIQKLGYNLIRESNRYFIFHHPLNNTALSIDILHIEKHHEVSLTLNNEEILSFVDKAETDKNSFEQELFNRYLHNGHVIKYKNSEQVFINLSQKKVSFIKPISKDTEPETNFITLDLETRTLQGPASVTWKL